MDAHVFDATLSLTGGCTTSTVDPVPDPGCPGGLHPANSFSHPQAVAVDSYGNIYVASFGKETAEGAEGRIDIFDSEGFYIAGSSIPDPAGPQSLAVDSEGNLYVVNSTQGERLVRYTPTTYEPASGNIAYDLTPTTVVSNQFGRFAVAINPADDHLFANYGYAVFEYGSAAEGNPVLDESIGVGTFGGSNSNGLGIAIDAAHQRIYASDEGKVRAFELEAPHALLLTVEGSSTPGGEFHVELSLAADEGTGHFFVFDAVTPAVYEFDEAGNYLATIEHGFQYIIAAEIAVDNGAHSPNGALNPFGRYLFVPSHPSGVGHVFAFGPQEQCAPEARSATAAQVTESEAVLRAEVDPCQLETTYTFQYTTRQSFEVEGFASAQTAGQGTLAAAGTFSQVSAAVSGLAPGTGYVFRVVASNDEGTDEATGSFTTYPGAAAGGSCPDEALRTGPSALLPDCRAYELVTPPDTNAHTPHGIGHIGDRFATLEASPTGDAVSFQIEGGLIPGSNGTGALLGDPYLATRGPGGWSTVNTGPDGTESAAADPGSNSPDQGYSFWGTGGVEGSAVVEGKATQYVRYPDGHSALIGRGSNGTDPQAAGKLISEGGSHIIFFSGTTGTTAVQLEPNAPPSGTNAIYDRTADEVTHVVSLLPESKTPEAGENAKYVGASLDGRGVAFEIGSTLYLRYDNSETYEIGEGVTFAGIAEGGNRIFYLEGGKLWRFDALTGKRTAFTTSGTAIPVNVSADGSAAYLVSTSVLTTTTNPLGAKAKVGLQNLYLSREGAISFVGILTERDVEGDTSGNDPVEGLGLWTKVVGPGQLGADPSRTTPDGSVLLFESRANLTGYDSEGHDQVYRYSADGELDCLSCSPVAAPATGSASLESITQGIGDPEPFSSFAYVANLRADGRRAVFQSTEALLPGDTDGLQDVYEWEADGVGSCAQATGCLYLISSGGSSRPDYLYAASASGDDVFFRSSDRLVPRDSDETPSIYDARVGGGFPEAAQGECQGEGCRSTLPAPPPMIGPESSVHAGEKTARRCPKGKRRVRRHGKVRCVKRKHHRRHHHHHRTGSGRKGAGR